MALKEQKVSNDQLAKLKAENPSAVKVTILGSIDVVIKPPTRMQWRAYRQAALSPNLDKQAAADEQLFLACCLVPDAASQNALIEQYPALGSSVAPVLAKLAGFDSKAESDF